MINNDDQNILAVLAYGISNNPYLMMGVLVLVLFFSCLLPFYTVPYRYILSRSPYFLLMTLLISIPFYLDKFFNYQDYLSIPTLFGLVFVQTFLAMTFSIMRARDGFGRGAFAILLLIPFLNIGLFTVSHEEGEKPYPKNHKELPLPRFFHGVCGVVIATIIWFLPFFLTLAAMIFISKPNSW